MFDIITQGAAVVDTLKKAVELSRKANNVELQTVLMDLREYVQDLREQVVALRQENSELREKATSREQLRWDGHVYWAHSQDGAVDGPFCPKCNDGSGKTARMANRDGDRFFRCVVCPYFVENGEVRKPRP